MKNKILILNEQEIRQCVQMDNLAMNEIEEGFSALSKGKATLPPILRIDIPESEGEIDVKTAYIYGEDSFAIKIASGFLNNYKLGLPTGSGMMVLISALTGNPIGILLDNGYLTDVRTGLAGAIAAKYLAPENVKTVGVFGSGIQARYQIKALKLIRNFSRLIVFGIIPEQVNKYAAEISDELNIEVIISDSPSKVVLESEVVVTTTPSRTPFLKREWLHPGLHITCMGSDSEEKQELFANVFAHVDRIVCDRKSQVFRLGEIHHALEEGILSQDDEITELGEIISGKKPGRQNETEITVCDLTGVGVQDTQIARLAYHYANKKELGMIIE